MKRLTTQELEAIRKRAEKATEGPWIDNGNEIVSHTNLNVGIAGAISDTDNEFIAAARTDIPKLLAEVERLRTVLTQIDELSDDFYNIESIDGVPTFVLRPDLEDYRDTIHEITVLPYEAINGGD